MSDKVGLEVRLTDIFFFVFLPNVVKRLCLNTDTLSAKSKGRGNQKKEHDQEEHFVLKNKKNFGLLIIFRDFHFQFLIKQSMLITCSKCIHVNLLRKALDSREGTISRKTQVSANYTIASRLMIYSTLIYCLNFLI